MDERNNDARNPEESASFKSDTPGQELPESAEQKPQNTVGCLLVLTVVIAVVGVTLYRNQGSVVRDSLESERSCYVRLYRNIDNTWVQIGQDLEGEAAEDDPFVAPLTAVVETRILVRPASTRSVQWLVREP